MKENESIDKLADDYSSTDSDQKAYMKAQAATIISQTKEINILKKQLEQIKEELHKSSIEVINLKANNPQVSQFQTSDEETTCVIQIAMIRQVAMQRELTLEETRKFEIFCKVLKEIHAKAGKETQAEQKMSDAELLEFMNSMMKGDNVG